MHPRMKHIYVGIDAHKMTHTAGIINCFHEKLGSITFKNDNDGFHALTALVKKVLKDFPKEDNITPVYGIEGTNGLGHSLAMFLLSNRYIVKSVDANYTYSERRNKAIISKSDDIDSLCIAKVTLNKLNELPSFKSDDMFWTLKQLVKMRQAITASNIEYKNKLHAQLLNHYPNYKEFFYNFACKTALVMWETYPSPDILKQASVIEFEEFLYRVSLGRISPGKAEKIFQLVDKCDHGSLEFQPERNQLIKMLVKQINRNVEELDILDVEINSVMDKIGYKLDTFIGIDKVSAAQIVSEIGNIDRFNSSDKLARYCGVAPVEFSSGSKDKTIYNKYGNRQLNSYIYRVACCHLSCGKYKDNPCSPIFFDYYNKKISEGKTKQQAITYIMRRIVRILYGMMKNKTEYRHPESLSSECMEKFKAELEKNSNAPIANDSP